MKQANNVYLYFRGKRLLSKSDEHPRFVICEGKTFTGADGKERAHAYFHKKVLGKESAVPSVARYSHGLAHCERFVTIDEVYTND